MAFFRKRGAVALGFAALSLALPALARADEDASKAARELRSRRFEQIRFGGEGVMASGTELVGVGSRGRYHRAGGAIEIEAHRFVTEHFGFGILFKGFPPTMTGGGGGATPAFGRGEGFLEAGVAAWGGAIPGSLVLGAGLGGDGPRYWFSENGRFYGLGFGRLRLFLKRDTRLQITYTGIPAALAAQHVRLHEHRFEVATGWKLLQIGTRFSYTFTRGGDPVRDFFQQELGAFVALSVY